jgi:hypothetical protein
MSRHLHLLRGDSADVAAAAIAAAAAQPDTSLTVVLLDAMAAPALPAGIRVLRLGANGLDHGGLLALIFESDRVVSW